MPDYKILGLDHLGIVPRDLALFTKFLRDLDLLSQPLEVVEAQKTEVHKFTFTSSSSPHTAIEALKPTTSDGPLTSFIEKNKGGIHHFALRVEGLEALSLRLKSLGYSFVSEKISQGHGKSKILFLHPKTTGGVLVELIEWN
jgi:methylmalonyl-CoA epimerase